MSTLGMYAEKNQTHTIVGIGNVNCVIPPLYPTTSMHKPCMLHNTCENNCAALFVQELNNVANWEFLALNLNTYNRVRMIP